MAQCNLFKSPVTHGQDILTALKVASQVLHLWLTSKRGSWIWLGKKLVLLLEEDSLWCSQAIFLSITGQFIATVENHLIRINSKFTKNQTCHSLKELMMTLNDPQINLSDSFSVTGFNSVFFLAAISNFYSHWCLVTFPHGSFFLLQTSVLNAPTWSACTQHSLWVQHGLAAVLQREGGLLHPSPGSAQDAALGWGTPGHWAAFS